MRLGNEHRAAILSALLCAALVGCGDDDGAASGAGGSGAGGAGGSAGMDAAVPGPATRVGAACSEASECDGPKPVCLTEIDPAAPFAGISTLLQGFLGGALPDGASLPSTTIEAPGGYCTSQDCTSSAQCGEGAVCYSASALVDALTGAGGGAGGGLGGLGPIISGFLGSEGGYCLQSCTDNGDCARSGYECRALIDFSALGTGDGGFALPADAGFQIPDDAGFSLPDGGIALPTYCLPAVGTDADGGSTTVD